MQSASFASLPSVPFRFVFAPPVFPQDAEKTRLAHGLFAVLLATTVLALFYCAFMLFTTPQKTLYLLAFVLIALSHTLFAALIHQSRVRLAALLFVTAFWVMVSVLVFLTGTPTSVLTMLYMPLMVITLLFLGGRASLINLASTLGYAITLNVVPSPSIPQEDLLPDIAPWMLLVFSFVLTLIPLFNIYRDLLHALRNLKEQLSTQEKAENSLRESQERFRLISTVTSDYTFSVSYNPQGMLDIQILSGAFERITGYTPEEFTANGGWSAIIHPDDYQLDERNMQSLRHNRPVTSELRIIRKDGRICWVRLSAKPVWDDEKQALMGINGGVQDITARKEAEAALQESERRYRLTTELISDYAYDYDIAEDGTRTLSWITEQSFQRLTGYDMEGMRNQAEIYHPDDRARVLDDIERTLRGTVTSSEYRIITRTGDTKWIHVDRQIEWNALKSRPIRYYGVATDITARKEVEFALAQERTLLRAVIDNLPDNIFVKDKDGKFILNNLESLRRLGVACQEDTLGKTDFDFFPHQLAEAWTKELQQIIERGEPLLNMEEFQAWHDEPHWIVTSIVPLRDGEGHVIGIVGINREITQQKQAEEALLKSEHRYRMTAELISDYAFAYDIFPDGSIELAWGTEHSYQRLTGYNWQEFPTQPALYHPDDRQRLLDDRQQAIEGNPVNGEYRIVAATGDIKWVSVTRNVEWNADHTRPIRFYGAITDITERKQAEIALQESEARMRALLDATTDMAFLLAPDKRFLTLNKPMAALMGQSIDSLIGQQALALLPDSTRDSISMRFETVTQTKQPLRWEESLGPMWFDVSIYPVLSDSAEITAFAVYYRNTTEEKRLAAELQRYASQLEQMVAARTTELRRAKEQIEIILNNTRDAIALAQPNGDIQTRNPAFIDMFGEQVSKWIEGLLWTVVNEEHTDSVGKALVNVIHEREGQRIEAQIATNSGDGKDIDLTFIPVKMTDTQDIPGILVSAHDITPFKEMERFKARFVDNAVHDLATPITALSTRLYLLKRSPEKMDEHIRALENQVEHFRDLLTDLRTLSQLDRKQVALDLSPCNLNHIVHRVFDTYEPMAVSNGETLLLMTDPTMPDIQLDNRQIERVCINLVSNAINYSSSGKTVRLSTSVDKEYAVLVVEDEGMGMTTEELSHVFERFYRTDRARKTRSSGTGLGLSIVKEVIELHGGTVTVQSEVGLGSTFTVRLPMNR